MLAVAGSATATMLYGRLLVEPELPYAVLCAAYVAVALVAAPGIVVPQHAFPSHGAELLVFALGMASFGALGRSSRSFAVDLANRRATATIVGFGLGLAGVGVGAAVVLEHAHPALFWIVDLSLHVIALAFCWRRLLSVFELSVCAAVAFSLLETFAALASAQPQYPLAPIAVLVDAVALSAAVLSGLLVETNAMYARLRTMAALDDLTGLPNRRMFDDRLDFALAHGERVHVPVAILVIDIDHFKKYNDRYGHLAGDAALRATSTAIATCVKRAGDTVARFGGEEFVVLLTGMSQSSAVAKAERIRHAVEDAAIPHEDSQCGTITVSVGLAYCARPHHEDQRALFEAADEALYAAKRNGRNRVEVQNYNRVDAYVRHLQQAPESESIIG